MIWHKYYSDLPTLILTTHHNNPYFYITTVIISYQLSTPIIHDTSEKQLKGYSPLERGGAAECHDWVVSPADSIRWKIHIWKSEADMRPPAGLCARKGMRACLLATYCSKLLMAKPTGQQDWWKMITAGVETVYVMRC